MFNDLYNFIPEAWRFYIKPSDLDPVISRLNRHRLTDVLPSKDRIFEVLTLINPEDVKIIVLGYPSPSAVVSSGIAYGIPFEYRFTEIYKRLPNPPLQSTVIDYLYSIMDGEKDMTLRDIVKRGVLLLNYPLTCSPGRKLSHVNYGWNGIVKRIIERLLYRNSFSLLLVAWNSDSFKLYTEVVPNWIPNIDSSCFSSPLHKNVSMIIANGPGNDISVNSTDDKYNKLAARYGFNNDKHRTIWKRAIDKNND